MLTASLPQFVNQWGQWGRRSDDDMAAMFFGSPTI